MTFAATGKPVSQCQICHAKDLRPIIFIGYLPPVNLMPPLKALSESLPTFPAEVLRCPQCQLVQLGYIVDPRLLFPPEYPYRSGTTRVLHENFSELHDECDRLLHLKPEDLVVDIGSNDGTLLSYFKKGGHRVHGVEPSDRGKLAQAEGIPTLITFFNQTAAEEVARTAGKAKVITATNVFAHIENIHDIVKAILSLLDKDGVFISESHYLHSLVETLQYDTIYHEHLRYYSLQALQYLFKMHDMEIIHAKKIPTHGGSIRVYAVRKGTHKVHDSVKAILAAEEAHHLDETYWQEFRQRVLLSKLELHALFAEIKKQKKKVYGIGAPSRASTLINYVGIDDGMVQCILEVKDSFKVNKFIPGTHIPVLEEGELFKNPPDYALLFSWHIADELIPKLTAKGFKGKFIVPLPQPRIVGKD